MEELLAYMQKDGLDGMFISRPVNVKYVSHYTGEDSWLLITEKEKFFSQIRVTQSRFPMSVQNISSSTGEIPMVLWQRRSRTQRKRQD